jgi:hypothetical protein
MPDIGQVYIDYLISKQEAEDDEDEPIFDLRTHAQRLRKDMVEFVNKVHGAPTEEDALFQKRFIENELSLAEVIGYIRKYEDLVKQAQ